MLRVIERYVFRELVRTFVLALLAITFVFFLGTAFRLLRDLTYLQILRTLPFAIPYLFPYSLPLSFLVSLTLTYGRLVADREVLALESCGVAPRSLAWPAIILGSLLSLASLVLQSSYIPYCHQRMAEAHRAVVEEMLALGEGDHWSRVFPHQGFDIYVTTHKGSELQGIVIHRDVDDRPVTITAERGTVAVADSGDDAQLELALSGVTTTLVGREKGTLAPRPDVRFTLPVTTLVFPVGTAFKVRVGDFTTVQLRELVQKEEDARRLGAATGSLAGALIATDPRLDDIPIEIAGRAALALAPLIFLAIGLPLTLALRHPNRLVPFVAGTAAVSLFYFVPHLLGRTLAERGDGAFWSYLGCAVGLLAGSACGPLERQLRGAGALRLPRLDRVVRFLRHALPRPLKRALAWSRVRRRRRRRAWAPGFAVLDWMMLRRFVATYLAFLASVLIVYVTIDGINRLHLFTDASQRAPEDVGRSALSLAIAYYAAIVPEIYYMLAPFVGLFAAMWVVFELRRNNELVPLMAAGIPPVRVVVPLFGATAFLAVVMYADREVVIPSFKEQRRASSKIGRRDEVIPNPVPDREGGVISAHNYTPRQQRLNEARYTRLESDGNVLRESVCAVASWATYVAPVSTCTGGWLFRDGFIVETTRAGDTVAPIPSNGRILLTDIRPEDVECATVESVDYLSSAEIQRQLDRIPSFRHLAVQLERRKAYPVSSLVLLLLGLPFVLRGEDKSSAALGLLACIGVCAFFFVCVAFFEDMGSRPGSPFSARVAVWIPNATFGAAGLIAFLRVAR